MIYQWFGQDPAANPVLGIDTNTPTFTDPQTGAVQTDTLATMVAIPATPTYPNGDLVPKGIYVAYNVNQTYSQPNANPPVPLESRVFMVASADGGRTFTTQELVSDLQHLKGGNIPQTGTEAANPQIIFSQGTAIKASAFSYNGVTGSSFAFTSNSTFADVQAALDTVPILNGNVTVTQSVGHSFIITFLHGLNPAEFSFQGPGSFTALGNIVTLTLAAPAPGGQMMVFYNDIYIDGGTTISQIFYDITQPDQGVAVAPVTGTKIFSSNTQQAITDGVAPPTGAGGTGGTADIPGITLDPIQVDLNATKDINTINLTSLDDLTVTVNLVHPNLDELGLILVPPVGSNLPSVTLLFNHVDPLGQVVGAGTGEVGLTGAGSIGEIFIRPNVYNPVGTVFDDNAPRVLGFEDQSGTNAVGTPTDAAPWIGHFQPEANAPAGSFTAGAGAFHNLIALINQAIASQPGLTLADVIKGNWTLEAVDNRASGLTPPPTQFITNWSINFTGLISTTTGRAGTPGFEGGTSGFGTDVPLPITSVPGGALNTYPTHTTVAPIGTPGIAPNYSVAIDNTLGSFSPFQGRVYLAYTIPPPANTPLTQTNIGLLTSDFPTGFGDTWTALTALGALNDDAPGDDFSEGTRTKINPTLAVDPVTGTLGAMWYDGRTDAAHIRIANSFTTSIDGGVTFAKDTFLNTQHSATDFYTGAIVNLEPIPDNLAVAGPFGFGDRSGLAMYGGRVYPFWSGNLDVGGSTIFTNTVTVAGGPRLVSGDMGALVSDTITGNAVYNNTFAADGTRQFDGFVLTFDRPVDPGSLTSNIINITYTDPKTAATTDLSNQITSVTPIDLSAAHGPNDKGTPPSFSISDTIVQEPTSGQTMAVFTVILSQPVGTPLAVNWATQDATGNAAAVSSGLNADYVASSGTVVFKAGQTTASFQVPVLSDALFTGNRYFLVNLTNSATVLIGRAQGRGTIIANANIPALTVGNSYVLKGNLNGNPNPTMNFPVFLSVPAPANVSVDFSFTDDTAFNGTDYTGTPGILTILAGSTTGIISIPLPINALTNKTLTGNVDFFLNLTNPVNASITRSQAVGVIVDDNALAVSVGATTVQLNPNGPQPNANVTFYLNGITSQPVTVNYQFANGGGNSAAAVNGVDYTGTAGSVIIPAGSQSATIHVPILVQSEVANKAFTVNIVSVVNAAPATTNTAAVVTIVDGTHVPNIIVGDIMKAQGITGTNLTYNLPVYLSFPNANPITVTYQTANQTAVAGTDYIAIPSTSHTILPGDTFTDPLTGKTVPGFLIPVTYKGNLQPPQPLNPTFAVNLNLVTGQANVARAQGIATIVSDTVQLSVGDITVTENASTANSTVNAALSIFLSGPSTQTITATISTGAGGDTAQGGVDYQSLPANFTVTFLPGQTVKTFGVPNVPAALGNLNILHDPAANTDPVFFTVTASNMRVGGQTAPASLISKPTGIATIVDADAQPSAAVWSIGDVTQTIPHSAAQALAQPFIFQILSNPALTFPQTVNVTVSGQGVVPGQSQVAFNLNSAFIPIYVLPNTVYSGNQSFTVTLDTPSTGAMSNTKFIGRGTIIDNNATTINIGATFGYVSQNATTFPFPVVISNAPPSTAQIPVPAITGSYNTQDGTATVAAVGSDGLDYQPIFGNPLPNNQALTPSNTYTLPVQVNGTSSPEIGDPGFEFFNTKLASATVAFSIPGSVLFSFGISGVATQNGVTAFVPGNTSVSFLYNQLTTTAAQLQADLNFILPGTVVSGNVGGPFNLSFAAGVDPALLTVAPDQNSAAPGAATVTPTANAYSPPARPPPRAS